MFFSSAGASSREITMSVCPGFRAWCTGCSPDHGHDDLLRLVLRHSGFERLLVVGDDRETLRWNPIASRRVSITAKRNAQFAFVVRGQNNAASYVLGQGLLEDPSVDDFN